MGGHMGVRSRLEQESILHSQLRGIIILPTVVVLFEPKAPLLLGQLGRRRVQPFPQLHEVFVQPTLPPDSLAVHRLGCYEIASRLSAHKTGHDLPQLVTRDLLCGPRVSVEVTSRGMRDFT